jgi:hypothetical protein
MSPSIEPAGAAAEIDALVPEDVLDDGEIVLLALRPSGWAAVIESRLVVVPALLGAGVLAILVQTSVLHWSANARLVLMACLLAPVFRLASAAFQWGGYLYVLTNRRAIRLRGTVRREVQQVRLVDVARAEFTDVPAQRLFSVGNVEFRRAHHDLPELSWAHLASAPEVLEMVREALDRYGSKRSLPR